MPVADSTPLVSVSVTVKVSPAVVPLSVRLTAGDRRRLTDPDRLAGVGAAIDGTPFTVTSIVCGVRNVAEAVGSVQRDGVGVPGECRAVRVLQRPRSVFTSPSEPVMVRVVPGLDTVFAAAAGVGRRQHAIAVLQRHREGLARGGAALRQADRR